MEFSDYLAVFGRMHPMVLHLPIGLLVGLGLMEFSAVRKRSGPAARGWYLLAAVTAFAAAASGWRLHEEDGYAASQVMEWHEWVGIATMAAAIASCVWRYRGKVKQARWFLAVACLLLLPTGHLGAEMTHGKGFLFEPLEQEAEADAPYILDLHEAALEEGPLMANYTDHIAPLLKARCNRCHGSRKVKGKLRLDTPEHILVGGEGGAVLGETSEDAELYRRLLLPLEHDDHMPPESKTQLRLPEVDLLRRWLDAGAPFEEGFALGDEDLLDPTGADDSIPEEASTEEAKTDHVDPGYRLGLSVLEEALVHAQTVGSETTRLVVSFAPIASDVDDAFAACLLEPLLLHIEDLSLAGTAIDGSILATIARMPALRRLDLGGTAITTDSLAHLRDHESLETLVLQGTAVDVEAQTVFTTLPTLKSLSLWATPITPVDLAALRLALPHVTLVAGDEFAHAPLEIEPELVFTSDAPPVDAPPATTDPGALLPQNTSCPVSDKPVDPRYTIVDDGQVIGLCCPDCAKAYWEEK